MSSAKSQRPYRNIVVIALLIGGVCFVTLTPAMYLAFHALQWQRGLHVLEAGFLPALFLAGLGYLFAYQRSKHRQPYRASENGDYTPPSHADESL